MKNFVLTFIIAMSAISFCEAQEIEMQKIFGAYQFTQDGYRLKMNDLVQKMESNPEALSLIKKAKSNNAIATVLGFAGGGLIGWSLGDMIGGREPNLALVGAGAGLLAIGIPISSGVNKNAKKAVDLYNASLDTTSYKYQPHLKMMVNSNGVGLALSF